MVYDGHVLYVGAQLPKRSETFVYREVLGLRKRGVEVSVASVNAPETDLGEPLLDDLAAEAIPVYGRGRRAKLAVYRDAARMSWRRFPKGLGEVPKLYWPKYMFQWEAGYALAFRVRELGVAHVHAHMAHVPATVALACAEALGVPFSFTGHAADLFRDRMALRTKLEAASFVACISQWHRTFYQSIASLPDGRLPVIRCGVDVEEYQPAAQKLTFNERGLPGGGGRAGAGGGMHLLSVGRLVPKKGFEVLLEALTRLPESVTLTLIGDGPEGPALQKYVAEHGLGGRVELAGAQSNTVVRERMGEADLFVLPCQPAADGDRDGIPVVLMEAMARGICVVSGDLPTIRELVADNVSGAMVRPGSADDLRQVLLRLWQDQALRERLAAAGRARVVEEFSLSTTLDRLETAFDLAAAEQDAVPAADGTS